MAWLDSSEGNAVRALIVAAAGALLISAAHAQATSSDPKKLSMSGYGCVSEREFVSLDALAMSGEFQAYRSAQANALASGACITFNRGQRVIRDRTDSVVIPGFHKETLVQVHTPGSSRKYWMLGIQLWGEH
jgi:hypothetical protein